MKMKKKRGVEPPFKIRTFVTLVTSTPMEDVDIPLAGFSWEFEKGDLYHWVDLLNYFETYFEKFVKPRRDLQLDVDRLEDDGAFPKQCVLQILRVTRILLENCMNKYLYNSNEHLSALFASSDPEVVISALETLAAFVKKPLQSNRAMRWHGDATLNARLFSMSQGWGGKEEGLGLLSCAIESGCDSNARRMGSTLHFEFYADGSPGTEGNELRDSSGLQVIHLSDMHLRSEDDLLLLKELNDKSAVPLGLRFSLLVRIRFAKAFASLTERRHFICIRLLAFTVLLQSNPDHEDLTSFFVNEPEFVNELVMLLRCEDSVPEVIRTLAILALAAQSQDRPRQSNVLSVISAGGHRGILPSLMQKAIGSLTSGRGGCTVVFVEALLTLVAVLVSSSSGCAALREAGLIPTLLPLLKDFDSNHTHLVSSAVHILEAFMDYSNPAGTLFRDLGGLDDTIQRLKMEVSKVEEGGSNHDVDLQLDAKGKMPMADIHNYRQSVQSETTVSYYQRLLLKALLRAIALGTYAPGSSTRMHTSEDSALPSCLSIIFRHSREFGGGVFSLAASVMSDLIHKDPTCFPALDAVGVPSAFLQAITAGVLPSSEAIGCIPNSLDALCLNNVGLQAVKDTNALRCFVRIFTSKMYLRALANDTPGSLASGLDELMRHAPSLRGPGIDMCVEVLKTIASIGGAVEGNLPALSGAPYGHDVPVPMDTDSEDQSTVTLMPDDGQQAGASQHSAEPSWEGSESLLESFLPECINNAVRLLETVLQNADASRIFIEKKGVEALLQLYTLPHLPVTFGGSSTAHNMSVTFRAFSPQHSSVLTHAVCRSLKDHLKHAVQTLESIGGAKIATVDKTSSSRIIKCLSAAECFISLAAVLVRSSAPMMQELSNGVSVLSDIGSIQREVLWQISLIDDAKCDMKRDTESYGSTSGSSMSMAARDGDDDGVVFPVIRYVNPLPSRNGPAHWGLETDFLPVLQGGIEGPPRRRRELPVTTESITQMARLGRLSRHSTDAIQVDFEPVNSLSSEASHAQESSRRKAPEAINYEVMTRLVAASRGLFIALGKAMVVPSSRRRDETVNVSGSAKVIASALSELLRDELSFDGESSAKQCELPVSVKCRYLGKVVEDITSVVFDSRRRACNTAMINCLVGHGAVKQLLVTFSATSQLLWREPRNFASAAMETENSKADREKIEGSSESSAWLSETLRTYARLLEQLVTSSLLMTPPSMAQLLVQPVSGGSEPIARDPGGFVRNLQAQVLEALLPVWSHPLFPQCNSSFITSIAAIITHIYGGVGDLKVNRGGGTASAHASGPPLDELAISRIVEMGFSRSRAEEALRRVEANSVEMATEWLCTLPEGGVQEDDELAHALALSLGGTDENVNSEQTGVEVATVTEEVRPQPPPVEDMLSTCMHLLQNADVVAFALADLFVTMCNRNKGHDRARVMSFLVQQLRQRRKEEGQGDGASLSTICHAMAIVLGEDNSTREIAGENGLVVLALDALTAFGSSTFSKQGAVDVPKWVPSMLLILHHMLQCKPRTSSDTPGGTSATADTVARAKSDVQSAGLKHVPKRDDGNPFVTILGAQTGYMTTLEQMNAIRICCDFLRSHLPATVTQAVLLLCARLTKTHPVAHQFLETGGLGALLDLPMTSLFPGFESVAATIIRHLLEDQQTLQQAMESEIRHTLISTLSRHSGRVSPRMFLTAMSSVVSRDPSIFMQAVGAVCQIDKVGGRPTVVLAKDREKERGRSMNTLSAALGGPDMSKNYEGSGKVSKAHKRIPASFSQVIDHLLEVILHHPSPSRIPSLMRKDVSEAPMDVDDLVLKDKGKAKVDDTAKQGIDNSGESSSEMSKIAFILKLATEILLMYSSAVSVVLRRDSESSQGRGPSQGGLDAIGHGGLIYHVLHRLLPYSRSTPSEKVSDEELRDKVSDRAAYFLMAVCVRSGEGRRRVVAEISRALAASAVVDLEIDLDSRTPNRKIQVFADLANSILSSHSPSNSSQPPAFAAEMAKSMLDAGMIQALTQCLKVVDLDHPDATKLVNAVLKVLEVLTRAGNDDQACDSDIASQKKDDVSELPEPVLPGADGLRASDSHLADGPRSTDEAMDTVHAGAQPIDGNALAGSENTGDEVMEYDMRTERNGTQSNADEEEFMREAAEDAAELEDAAVEMVYRMEHGTTGVGDDDEDDMEGEEGEDEDDEDDDDEEDEDDIEGDVGVSHLSPPDTDVEDHEETGLGDEYEDDMVDDEDDEDDWHEDRVLEVRWRDGLTGLNHVQVLGHTSAANLVDFSGDPFQGMNTDDVFGNFRRPGVGDRRRPTTYRSFSDRNGDRSGAFHHPLLTRPPLLLGTNSSGSVAGGSLWANAGNFVRDAEAMLGGGGLDVTHFYMYDAPLLPDHGSDGLFGDRGVSAPPPPLLDFSMDPPYLMGRRGGRVDSRLTTWTDDGQPQAGAQAAALAQAIEEQFVSHLQSLVPRDDRSAAQERNGSGSENNDRAEERRVAEAERIDEANVAIVNSAVESGLAEEVHEIEDVYHGNADDLNRIARPRSLDTAPGEALISQSAHRATTPATADFDMQEERNEVIAPDIEAGSQDSAGSGATVGESLRSLEVEIGSADGHDADERQGGSDRTVAGESQRVLGVEIMSRRTVPAVRTEALDMDEEMEGSGSAAAQRVDVGIARMLRIGPNEEEAPLPSQPIDTNRDRQGDPNVDSTPNANLNPIDPTFLEALPEDLRAEVLASQQIQTLRPLSRPPSMVEEIDPEFLAALPPDIQAEVLAQQRAQRTLHAHHVEGQPVDMDSASIIATFPSELREEVLLTSSEAVLAALPPALLAEAQLLRERAMNQYQARGLFGGHRIASRRSSVGVSMGGGAPNSLDRSVVGGPGQSVGRRSVTVPNNGPRSKEAEGKAVVDTAALKSMLRLLQLAQPLGKGLLQRLLLNLCAHNATRVILVQLLLNMLRPEAEGTISVSSFDGPSLRLYGCQWNVVYARSQVPDGVPPLVSRRVLEIMTYLARNHPSVADLFLYIRPEYSQLSLHPDRGSQKANEGKVEKGKAKVIDEPAGNEKSAEARFEGEIPLILFLQLLSQPLYSRSSAHLEQVMGLLEVVTSNAGAKAEVSARSRPAGAASATLPADTDGALNPREVADNPRAVICHKDSTLDSGTQCGSTGPSRISASELNTDMDAASLLMSLPEPDLRNLCTILACEGLSDTAYARVAEVLKKLAAAVPAHRKLFVSELAAAARRLGGPAVYELENLGDADNYFASSTSMAGAAILRVLQALGALVAASNAGKDIEDALERDHEDGIMAIRDLNTALENLWFGLSSSVGRVECMLGNSNAALSPSTSAVVNTTLGGCVTSAPLPAGAQKLLPFVEGFFVLCEKLRSGFSSTMSSEPFSSTAQEIKEAASCSISEYTASSTPKSPTQLQKKHDEKGMTFIRFAERHRRLLNAFLRQNPALLEKSFSMMLKVARLIDFDNKRAYFRSRIRQQHEQQHYAPLRICVRRAYVLEDSYNQLRMRTPDELKGRLTVQFQGEEGIDAGGLTREWYQLLSRVTFDKGALLFTTVGNDSTFQPNPNSVYQTEHLSYFKFVGRVVGKALFDGQLLDVYFTRSFYKHILGVKVTYHDIEAIDPDYYKNLKWMLENDISDIIGLTFSMDADEEKHILYEKTEVTDYELIAGGRNVRVTEENKHSYVDLVAEHRLTTAIRPQITSFLEGFNELISKDLVSIFNDKELELLISGLPEIDLEDLKANTEYTGYTAASPVVQWFWEAVKSFSKEDMARLLQFITGTSKVPLEGFRALQGISGPQKFQIHKAYGAPERLPSAHTCFNQLDLPEYSLKEQLLDRLLLAIHEASEGFGFG